MITDLLPLFDRDELYELPVVDQQGTLIGKFVYKQATIGETIRFYQKLKGLDIFREYVDKFFKPTLKDKGKVMTGLLYAVDDLVKVFIETMHKRRKSAYDGAPKLKGGGRPGTRGSNVQAVCKAYNLPLTDLLQNYSFEQLDRMSDQVSFYFNETDKEAQRINDYVMRKQDTGNVDVEKAKKLLEIGKTAKVVSKEVLSFRKH